MAKPTDADRNLLMLALKNGSMLEWDDNHGFMLGVPSDADPEVLEAAFEPGVFEALYELPEFHAEAKLYEQTHYVRGIASQIAWLQTQKKPEWAPFTETFRTLANQELTTAARVQRYMQEIKQRMAQ